MASHPQVKGTCPMGCGETLFLGQGGYVTCGWLDCPRPDAAHRLLSGENSATVEGYRWRDPS